MLFFVIAGFLLFVALIAIVASFFQRDPETRAFSRVIAGGFIALIAIVIIIFGSNVIPARTVAIQTTFGANPVALQSGYHFLAPWSETERFETLMQKTDLNDKDGTEGNAVNVTFSAPKTLDKDGQPVEGSKDEAGGGKGKISAVVNWKISESGDNNTGAVRLWSTYKSFDRVGNDLVLSKSQDTINDVANDFPAGQASVDNTGIAQTVKIRLGEILKPYGIEVVDVSVKAVDLDAGTQASLQKIVDRINSTRSYEEELKGQKVQTKIIEEQKRGGALEAAAQQNFCLKIVNSWDVKTNGKLPETFNCGLGSPVTPVLPVK